MSRSLALLALPLLGLYANVAQAAETGNIRGKVEDDGGLPVPGAIITLSGASIAGELSATADDNGEFRILNVPPGQHTARVVKPGLTIASLKITVRLDETVFVPVVLRVSGGMEIVIEETLPVIDTTRSAISTELTSESLANLPIGRSYQDAVVMLPGVSGRTDTEEGGPSQGNPSVRGEGQYGNNYLLDGISTRDPSTKTFGQNVQYDAISDIQVYTDGAPAEFGQATGMLVNVVTKDGGDEHHGSAAYIVSRSAGAGTYAIRDSLDIDGDGIVAEEVEYDKRFFVDDELALTAGGPIIKEKLWYFGSLSVSTSKAQYEGSSEFTQPRGMEGFAKLTWFATPELTLRAQFSGTFQDIPNYETSSLFAASAQSRYHSDDYSPSLKVDWRLSPNSILEAQGIYQNGHINVSPMSDDVDAYQVFNIDTGGYSGNYDSYDFNQRGRAGGLLRFTQLVNNFLGDHKFKAGVEYWVVTDTRELTYTGGGEAEYLELGRDTEDPADDSTGVRYTSAPSLGYPCLEEDHSDCYGKEEYRGAGALGHTGQIFTAFLQDDWQPVRPLTLNVGVRADFEKLLQNEGSPIVAAWMWQPRLGAAWDITNDSKTLLSVNAGRYYDVAGNSFAEWGDTRSSYVFAQYENDGDPTDGSIWTNTYTQDPELNPLIYCNQYSLSDYEDHLVADYELTAEQAAEERAKVEDMCGGELKPYHMDKMAIGFKREILPLFAVGVRGIISETVDLPEDVDVDWYNWVVSNPESKRRDYWALEFTAERKFDKHWQLLASYTLSESKGTMPGQFELASGGSTGSNGNEVGVYLDDIADAEARDMYFNTGWGWLLDWLNGLGRPDDDAGYYGYLPYHSFHSVKVNGSYTFDFGTTLGLVYEFDSGHAWQKRGYVDLYQDYFAFPEGRGTRLMPPVNYVDARIAHRVEFKGERSAELGINVYNVFDFETPITAYENDNASFGLTLYRQAPRSVEAMLKVTY